MENQSYTSLKSVSFVYQYISSKRNTLKPFSALSLFLFGCINCLKKDYMDCIIAREHILYVESDSTNNAFFLFLKCKSRGLHYFKEGRGNIANTKRYNVLFLSFLNSSKCSCLLTLWNLAKIGFVGITVLFNT